MFQSIIEKDIGITNVEKLHYLKVSLKNEAETLIRNLPTVSENYQRAWNVLAAHFENKRLLVRSYFSTFTALMKIKNANKLMKIPQCVNTTVSSLESIGRPVANCEDLFVHLTAELLDARSRCDWEESISATTEPSYVELKDFLERKLHS